MERRRLKTIIGLGLVGTGLLQAVPHLLQREWLPTAIALLYTCIGVLYLWVEVYSLDE